MVKTDKDHWKQDSSTKKDKVAHAGKKVACWSLGMGYPKTMNSHLCRCKVYLKG